MNTDNNGNDLDGLDSGDTAPFNLVNLTPHTLNLGDMVLPSSGLARVSVTQSPSGWLCGLRTFSNSFGDVTGLPDPAPNTAYVVSGMVLGALAGSGRTDVFAPDTGATATRVNGMVTRVNQLVSCL